MSDNIAMAIAAHPDDIEFMMGGTLLLLKKAGYDTHYLNVSTGSCGSMEHDADRLTEIRMKESRSAAQVIGARYHPPLGDDLEIFYTPDLIRRIGAVIRQVHPTILLLPSPQDYMEDHTNTCRLAVTAAFSRSFKNFKTIPEAKITTQDITLYHAMPHGLRDSLRKRIDPGAFVNINAVTDKKKLALSHHKSQQRWLDKSQKMSSYTQTMMQFSREVGTMSKSFEHAEGWRRHLHYGFCSEQADPLAIALKGAYQVNEAYETDLDHGFKAFTWNEAKRPD